MAPKTSIRQAAKAAPAGETPAKLTDPFAVTVSKAKGEAPAIRPGYKLAKAREVLPHVSIYLHPRVIKTVKEIADVEGVRAHAIYLMALDQYLTEHHGTSLDKLSRE